MILAKDGLWKMVERFVEQVKYGEFDIYEHRIQKGYVFTFFPVKGTSISIFSDVDLENVFSLIVIYELDGVESSIKLEEKACVMFGAIALLIAIKNRLFSTSVAEELNVNIPEKF